MLKELESKQFKWEILLKEPKKSRGMTTVNRKADRKADRKAKTCESGFTVVLC